MSDLFENYGEIPARRSVAGVSAWDEMFSDPGSSSLARPPYQQVHRALKVIDSGELRNRADALATNYLSSGVTFDFAGEERAFPLDPLPRIIHAAEWDHIESGVKQRVKALEALLEDVYTEERAIKDGVLPATVVASSSDYFRPARSVHPANGVRIHVAGIDLIRDEHGTMRVLEDNVRIPSGVSYVISNREAIGQTLPEMMRSSRVRPVDHYPSMLLQSLRNSAPEGVEDPTVVVMTPGVYNSAYYEHTLLARLMGVELVEGSDLYCRDGRVFMRTTRGARQVDVIYRRVDDAFLDPVSFRPDSVLGTPGLFAAARAGNVTLANAVGNGMADDKLMYTYIPDLIRYYLGEEPILENVPTWRLEEPDSLEEVLDRLDELVVKPVDGAGGKGILIGPDSSARERELMAKKLRTDPRGWIAQPMVVLSTLPTLVDGGIRPRHADLRPFAVNDSGNIQVLPGGLTRVALPEGQLVVNSSQGGGSKDTWVIDGVRSSNVLGLDSLPDDAAPSEVGLDTVALNIVVQGGDLGIAEDSKRPSEPAPDTVEVPEVAEAPGVATPADPAEDGEAAAPVVHGKQAESGQPAEPEEATDPAEPEFPDVPELVEIAPTPEPVRFPAPDVSGADAGAAGEEVRGLQQQQEQQQQGGGSC
ncbi:circularly permuted type 2 ATP-grasp protein [Galactobacter sp.]|uniref:circularly permuted type 2 ATP-grasp protein n=1 Tax=Galactobacter sp. TaxID=2676125 RepID=UPI0025C52346|nr:circularly permuted type 2 ATP-grasp protein [Galactobacter sp.]